MIDVVCGIISNAAGEILACQRPAGKHLAGLWEFPGGKVDPGESPEAALIRELHEELEIQVSVEAALTPVIWAYGEKTIRLLPYHCRITTGTPTPVEHQALLWCSSTTYQEIPWADADIPILLELFPASPANP